MAEFFDQFPKVRYNLDPSSDRLKEYDFPLNIFVRFGFLSESFDSSFFYYEYVIKDTDKPEILAEKIYNDPEAHWIILLANKMIDPLYDWPLTDTNFQKFIIKKYGSIATAKTDIQRYEKVIKTLDNVSGLETIRTYEITQSEYNTLPSSDPTGIQKTLPNGEIVTVYEYRNILYAYDYEFDLNEKKRNIKIIKADFYPQIKAEFDQILSVARGDIQFGNPLRRI